MAEKKAKAGDIAKKWLLGIAIAIVFAMFVSYGIRTFYPEPQYDNYCNATKTAVLNLSTQEACVKYGGQWTTTANTVSYAPSPDGKTPAATVPVVQGYCNPDFTCSQAYNEASNKYQDAAFIITIVAGFLGLVLGIILSIKSISLGLLLGGILNLFIGTVSYWGRFQNNIKFVILGAIFILLIWIGWKKLK